MGKMIILWGQNENWGEKGDALGEIEWSQYLILTFQALFSDIILIVVFKQQWIYSHFQICLRAQT